MDTSRSAIKQESHKTHDVNNNDNNDSSQEVEEAINEMNAMDDYETVRDNDTRASSTRTRARNKKGQRLDSKRQRLGAIGTGRIRARSTRARARV